TPPRSERLGLRAAVSLNGRTRHRAVRAEYAAISWVRLETFATTLAVIKEPAGVLRHSLKLLVPALGACDGGLGDHANLVAKPSRGSCAAGAPAQRSQEQSTPRILGSAHNRAWQRRRSSQARSA